MFRIRKASYQSDKSLLRAELYNASGGRKSRAPDPSLERIVVEVKLCYSTTQLPGKPGSRMGLVNGSSKPLGSG
jgi:hypothetical protein